MAPQPICEYLVSKLVFSPNIDPKYPVIVTQTCDQRKQSIITKPAPKHWFNRIMSRELSELPHGTDLRFCEWIIESGDHSLFMPRDYRYEEFIMILGGEVVECMFYTTLPFRVLSCSIPVTLCYCSCCFRSQYLNIIKKLHEIIINQGETNE